MLINCGGLPLIALETMVLAVLGAASPSQLNILFLRQGGLVTAGK
jgi:hypothetical protein